MRKKYSFRVKQGRQKMHLYQFYLYCLYCYQWCLHLQSTYVRIHNRGCTDQVNAPHCSCSRSRTCIYVLAFYEIPHVEWPTPSVLRASTHTLGFALRSKACRVVSCCVCVRARVQREAMGYSTDIALDYHSVDGRAVFRLDSINNHDGRFLHG